MLTCDGPQSSRTDNGGAGTSRHPHSDSIALSTPVQHFAWTTAGAQSERNHGWPIPSGARNPSAPSRILVPRGEPRALFSSRPVGAEHASNRIPANLQGFTQVGYPVRATVNHAMVGPTSEVPPCRHRAHRALQLRHQFFTQIARDVRVGFRYTCSARGLQHVQIAERVPRELVQQVDPVRSGLSRMQLLGTTQNGRPKAHRHHADQVERRQFKIKSTKGPTAERKDHFHPFVDPESQSRLGTLRV